MKRFKTLLQREWMQHQRGWIVLMALPLLVFLLVGVFGSVQFDIDDMAREAMFAEHGPMYLAVGSIAGLGLMTLLLAWAASLLQSPGLARRDVQDRSIEFWLSLPVPHSQALGATLLAHLLLVPWLALAVGLGGGVLLSLVLVAKTFGIGAWFALPWATIAAAALMLALRLVLGLLLATLWLAPLILGTMAAAAWLRRWGVPVVLGVLTVGGSLLQVLYDQPFVGAALASLWGHARHAFFAAEGPASLRNLAGQVHGPEHLFELLGNFPAWALRDSGDALAALATPAFAGALLVSAAAFGLLVLRRQRGA